MDAHLRDNEYIKMRAWHLSMDLEKLKFDEMMSM